MELTALLVMGAAGIIHAMMQLGVSVLTLLSGHSLGKKSAHARLLRLNFSYITGAALASALVLSGGALLANSIFFALRFDFLLIGTVILSLISALSILRFYYRKSPGTLLWIPRSLAEYLSDRAKKTKNSFEAGALGAMTVVMELPFTFPLFAIVSIFFLFLMPDHRLLAIIGYATLTVLPLLVITVMIGAGHRLSTIQRWREQNKHFLQYASSFGLISLALFIYFYFVKGPF